MYIIDETFKAEPAKFRYVNLKSGLEVSIETLERLSNPMFVSPEIINADTALDDADSLPLNQVQISEPSDTQSNEVIKRPGINTLKEQNLSFRLGQTGVSYKKLFAPYLENASEITIEDPYIRGPWQIKNFMEFVTMLIDTRSVDDLKLNLITNEEDERAPELIDRLEDIKEDLAEYGIEFSYKLRDFHDRCIKTDTGWTITLGRGLDIFEKYSPYSIEAMSQDKRKCKDFMVNYINEKA